VSSRGTLTSFVVDEAVAVFLHFNLYADGEEDSEFMVDGNLNMCRRRRTARRRLDATFIKNIVDHFCAIKSCAPIWIRNRYAPVQQARPSPCDGPPRRHHEGSVHAAPPRSLTCSRERSRVARAPRSSRRSRRIISERLPEPGSRCATRGRERGPSERRPEWIKYCLLAQPQHLWGVVRRRALRPPRVPRQLPVRAGRETSRVRQLRDGGCTCLCTTHAQSSSRADVADRRTEDPCSHPSTS
jgi:hypothetical protein